MTKEQCRLFARAGCPVVHLETGTSSEIVYRRIVHIGVDYADEEEMRERGFPAERLTVTVADKSGRSFTETTARQLRIPTVDEAMEAVNAEDELREFAGKPKRWTLERVDQMIAFIKEMREAEHDDDAG